MTLKVLKYNKNHYPAGSPKGGQFAPSKGRKPVESFFNNEPMQGIDHYNEVGFKSKEKLVPMKIDDFLKLAYPVTEGGDPGKNKGIKEMVDRGETFGIPFLEIRRSSDTPEIAEVVGHEGRHRGMYLKSLGYDTMPVKLRSDIRWSEQSDKSKFDYVDVWPKKLSSESVRLPNGEYKSLHILEFPVSREDATTSYKDLAKKPTVTKRNPNHYPAGSSKGGQFAPSKGNGGAKVTPPKSSAADTLSDYPITPDIAYDHPGESPEKLAEMSAMFAIKCDGEYTIPDITANITGPTGQARKNAEAMGFDLNQVWVHGSMSDIEEFIVNGEKVNGDSFWGKGAYFSSSPEDSSANYANREGPDFSNTVQNAAEIRFYQRHPDLNWDADLIEKYRQEIIRERTDSMGVVYPVYLAMKKPLKEDGGQFEISESRTSALARKVASVSKELGLSERTADEMKFYFTTAINRDHNDYDLLLNFRDSLSAETLIDDNVTAPEFTRHLAMKFGYDGVIMDAKRQFPHMPHMPQGTKHAIIWKPNQIRSVFAKFNLEDRNSANILKVDLKEVFKSNPNHYPAGAPGGKGGQFAPTHNKGKTVTGYHWSHQEALTETDPAKYGTGIKGAEASRLARQPDIKDRTYFYTTPTMREPGLGIHQYSTELTHMYDTAADEEGYKAIAKEKATPKPPFYGFDQVEYTNTLERLIKQGGYRGYLSSTMGGTAVSFYPAKVKKVIKKSNPNHYPAGSSKGGQFAPSNGNRGPIVSSPGQSVDPSLKRATKGTISRYMKGKGDADVYMKVLGDIHPDEITKHLQWEDDIVTVVKTTNNWVQVDQTRPDGSFLMHSYFRDGNNNLVHQWDEIVFNKTGSGLCKRVLYSAMEKDKRLGVSKWKLQANIQVGCVPTRGKILTKRGFLHHYEIKEGDETLGFNFVTEKLEWTPIEGVSVYPNSPVKRVYSKNLSLVCTEAHRLIASKLTTKDGHPFWTSPGYVVPEDLLKNGRRLIMSAEVDQEDTSGLSEDMASLLGWIVTDGWVNIRHRRGYLEVCAGIGQQKQEGRVAIMDLLARLGSYKGKPSSTGFYVPAVHTRSLYRTLGIPFEKGAIKEVLPSVILKMGVPQLRAFTKAAYLAEGSLSDSHHRFHQNPGPVLEACRLAYYLLGKFTRVSQWKPTCASFNIHSQTLSSNVIKVEDGGYEDVWCPETVLGTWTVDIDGQIMVTGNSYAWAKYGFEPVYWGGPEQESWGRKVMSNLAMRGLTQEQKGTIAKLVKSKDPKVIWAISDIKETNKLGEALGKIALIGASWTGQLRLDDPIAMERFSTYIKRK